MSATPEQIAERLALFVRAPHAAYLAEKNGDLSILMDEAAATLRAQAERVRVLEALLQRLEPSIGWRSATGTSRDFACEFCHQTHAHFAHIEHTDACPVTQVRAALKAAP